MTFDGAGKMIDDGLGGLVAEARPTFTGAGTELKKLLTRFGIVATGQCACNAMAARMDRLGASWCREHVEEIVDAMAAEAQKRGLPFLRLAAVRLVRFAIFLSER